jgi:hypothetical protein
MSFFHLHFLGGGFLFFLKNAGIIGISLFRKAKGMAII